MPDDDILDAINEGRFPSAKRDLASKLKRFPNKSYYWALQCYYLYACGDIEQSEKECRILKQKIPSDPESLELLADVFKKLGHKRDANEVWENAVKKYPTTSLILTWFNRAVDNFDARNMQKASMILQKHASLKREYRVWAALANYLWSLEALEEKEKNLHISLALGLIEKAEPLHNNQETFVKAQILAAKKDYTSLVSVLLALPSRDLDLTLLYLDALDQSENWQKLHEEASRLLFDQNFNDFDTWKHLIRASHHLEIGQDELQKLNTLDSRNSYVANMEIASQYGSGMESAIDTYWAKFSAKPCCSLDLSNYALSTEFFDRITLEAAELVKSDTIDARTVAVLTNVEKLLVSRDSSHKVDWTKYAKYDYPELSDLYVIHVIQDLAENWTSDRLVLHIVHLEHFAKTDPENFRVKLWLLNLYGQINASSFALKVYSQLAIKMVQHDLYLYKVEPIPNGRNLKDLVQTFRFYLTSDEEVKLYVGCVFEKELYTKTEDFLRFGKRLSTSLSRHLLVLKIMRMARRLHSEYYNYFYRMLKERKEVILSDEFSVCDNRDFKTEYNVGIELGPLAFQNHERAKGKEYVQLHYLVELLVVEKNDVHVARYLKLLNKWLSTPAYVGQLTPFESHVFKLYLSIFKIVKDSECKDFQQQVNFVGKNLDFKKFRPHIAKLPPLSGELSHMLVEMHEIIGLIRALLKNSQLLDLAQKLEKDIAQFQLSLEQMDHLRTLRSKLQFPNIPQTFVDEKFDMLEDGLRNSTYKP